MKTLFRPASRCAWTPLAILLIHGGALNAQTIGTPGFTIEPVISGLTSPTQIAFVDANSFFVIEKNTGIVKRVVGGTATTVLDLPVNFGSERGGLGLTLHPAFPSNNLVYIYYSNSSTGVDTQALAEWTDNRVERYTWNGTMLTAPQIIVSFPLDPAQANGPNHDGGVILFGPDGKLYGVTGDLNRGRLEQNQSATSVAGVGGVFRLNEDGTIPADNPFAAHGDPAIRRLFSYGVRNSFGLSFDSLTNSLWMTENGPGNYDEINDVPAGWNGGWTVILGPDERDEDNVSDLVMIPGASYSDPEFSFFTPVAVTPILFLNSGRYPCTVRGKCIVGDVNLGNLYLFTMNAARDGFVLTGDLADLVADSADERNQVVWGNGWGDTTDLKIGPDGYLYHLSLNGFVRRIRPITPVGDANGNGSLAFDDIAAYALALADPAAYGAQFPTINLVAMADTNCDALADGRDVAGFVHLLLGDF